MAASNDRQDSPQRDAPTEPQRLPDRTLDFQSLKALAHPLRVQILDTLSQYGPMTSSGLADRLAESSGATSYHLRQLEKHDFIREVKGRGTARERWWETTPGGLTLHTDSVPDSTAGRAVADTVLRQWQRNAEALVTDFLTRGDEVLSTEWMEASMVSRANVRVTAEQLAPFTAEMQRAINAVVDRYRDQNVPGERPVQIQFNAFPLIDGEESKS